MPISSSGRYSNDYRGSFINDFSYNWISKIKQGIQMYFCLFQNDQKDKILTLLTNYMTLNLQTNSKSWK